MGRIERIIRIGKWTAVLIVVMVAVPGVLAAATYTNSSRRGCGWTRHSGGGLEGGVRGRSEEERGRRREEGDLGDAPRAAEDDKLRQEARVRHLMGGLSEGEHAWGKKMPDEKRREVYGFCIDVLRDCGFRGDIGICKKTAEMVKEFGMDEKMRCNCA
jgi:hypothetical protein